jgi:acyl-coenzyme A synthetase/AMP-(fatty) acid ligase
LYAFGPHHSYSYATFLQAIADTASLLPDSRYAINICTDRFAFAVGFFAALLRGQTNILLPGPGDNTKAGALASFPDAHFLDNAHIAMAGTPGDFQPQQIWQRFEEIPPQHVAAIVFSSGTTGLHKQISKSWSSLYGGANINKRCIAALLNANGSKNKPTRASMIATVPPWHMYGLEWSVMLPLHVGLEIYAASTLFPEDIRVGLAAATAPRVLLSTPLHLRALLDSGAELPEIKLVLSATAPLDIALARRIEADWSCRVLEIYGCSEVGSMAHRKPAQDSAWEFFPELEVMPSSDGVSVTYPHSGESVRLSDHLEFAADGRFTLTGRDNDMVKVAGKRGSLAAINNALLSINGVVDGVVYDPASLGMTDTGRLAAVVVTDSLSITEIRAALQPLLDSVFVPRPIRLVKAIPRNATGKLAHADLLELATSHERAVTNGD